MSWQQVNLSEVADVDWGNTSLTKASYVDSGFPAFSATGQDGYLTKAEHSVEGIVLSAIGARCGKCFLASGEWTAIKNTITIIPNPAKINLSYLYALLNDEKSWQTKGAAQPFITLGIARNRKIPLPPLAEQQSIAAILDKASEIKTKREQAIAKLDELAQSTFVEMFGDLVANDKNFDLLKLQDVTNFENGDRSSNYPSGDDIKDNGVLFLSTKNIKDNQLNLESSQFITEEKYKSLTRGKVKDGDLIITLRGTLGSCCVFNVKNSEAFINAQMMIIRPKEMINSPYLHSLITSKSFQVHLQRIGNGAAVPQLTATQLKDLLIPVPHINQQIAFKQVIEVITKVKAKLIDAVTNTDNLIKSLQHQAFITGFNT